MVKVVQTGQDRAPATGECYSPTGMQLGKQLTESISQVVTSVMLAAPREKSSGLGPAVLSPDSMSHS